MKLPIVGDRSLEYLYIYTTPTFGQSNLWHKLWPKVGGLQSLIPANQRDSAASAYLSSFCTHIPTLYSYLLYIFYSISNYADKNTFTF